MAGRIGLTCGGLNMLRRIVFCQLLMLERMLMMFRLKLAVLIGRRLRCRIALLLQVVAGSLTNFAEVGSIAFQRLRLNLYLTTILQIHVVVACDVSREQVSGTLSITLYLSCIHIRRGSLEIGSGFRSHRLGRLQRHFLACFWLSETRAGVAAWASHLCGSRERLFEKLCISLDNNIFSGRKLLTLD